MLLENRTDEGVYYTLLGISEKIFIPPGQTSEVKCSENFVLKLFHNNRSDYYLEKFTKSPKSNIRVNTSFSINNTNTNTRIIVKKSEQPIDYIFSYISHFCLINVGEIVNIEYDVIDSELLMEKHKNHLKKESKNECFLIPLAFLDVGLTIFLWKWCGLKIAMIVLFLSLIFCFFINAMITLLFSHYNKTDKQYLKYFTKNFMKTFIEKHR